MKWMSIYLIGYLLFMGAVFLALSHLGILDDMGPTWTLISVLFALVRKVSPERVLEELKGTGGKVLRTNLSHEDEARLQQAISTARAA